MTDFEELRADGRIEDVTEDRAKARSLLERSKTRLDNQRDREITESNAFEILENIYESMREALEAGMAVDGFKSEDHVSTIAYGEEKLGVEKSVINQFHRFRKLRNESRYEAREITEKEARQILKTAESVMEGIHGKIKEKI